MHIIIFILCLFLIVSDRVDSTKQISCETKNTNEYNSQHYGKRAISNQNQETSIGMTPIQKKEILEGVNSTQRFTEFLKEKDFSIILANISQMIEPIFRVALASISAEFFLKGIESSEIGLMKKEFINLNKIFDKWNGEYQEMKYMIGWENIQTTFGPIENTILNLRKFVEDMSDIPSLTKEVAAELFIGKYESGYKPLEDVLYSSLINVEGNESDNIIQEFLKSTDYDRRKVQELIVELVKLLAQSMHMEAMYITFKYDHNEDYASYVKSLWQKKLQILKEKIEIIDNLSKNQYSTQYGPDLDNILESRVTLTNSQFVQVLYNILSKKYYWRDWFVLVYKELSGFKDHTVSTCQGTHRFRSHGRNVIVSSVDKVDGFTALSHIDRNKEIIGNYNSWSSDKEYARGWVNYFSKIIPNCTDADTRVAVAFDSDLWYVNTSLVVYKKNCVNNKSPCYDTFLFA